MRGVDDDSSGRGSVDRRGRLLKLLVTAGQCGDAPQAERLLEELQPATAETPPSDPSSLPAAVSDPRAAGQEAPALPP